MNTQAQALKQQGNDAFSKGKIGAAIDAYSEAICLEPSNAVYRTNRALCHQKKGSWQKVIDDCDEALKLDSTSVKAHYLLGAAAVELLHFALGIKALTRALELCRETTVSYKEDILKALLLARRRQWESKRQVSMGALERCEELLPELLTRSFAENELESEEELHEMHEALAEALELLRSRRAAHRVPDHFCCSISMELMLDPVITPSGVTFERSALREHLDKVGPFDPVTRRQLSIEQVAPNLALKAAIDEYVLERPWAYLSDF
uniref:E3 ubiquitin-protein ligase CHIP n=1 Tax=Chrysotila carterae TaxID=13221 RepID=A0A7S4BIQ1_CHRCT|mmetsp:Transcript_25819/g.56622  ORF Transcript_25819/g.56622 Transcript_25819/m.56622 type:complete len:265 (+) Transcript_25819:168-962(+)